jgi:IrrE N-terminal-like domain
MLPDIPADELASCLDRTAGRLLRRAGVRTPPVDALRVAATLGIQTAVDASQAARARYVELRAARGRTARPAILLRPEPRAERRQWAVAHELGEREAATIFRRLSVDPRAAPPTAREWVANQMANRILLPTRWMLRAGTASDWDLLALKARFSTASHELILRRMLEFSPPIVVTIFDHGVLSFRRGNVGGRLAFTPEERACRLAAHDSGQVQEQFTTTSSIRCWPVHEEGWKRELLRLELQEGFDEGPSDEWQSDDASVEDREDQWLRDEL